jgi:hypothetical protein
MKDVPQSNHLEKTTEQPSFDQIKKEVGDFLKNKAKAAHRAKKESRALDNVIWPYIEEEINEERREFQKYADKHSNRNS